jgi:hypothetical protein
MVEHYPSQTYSEMTMVQLVNCRLKMNVELGIVDLRKNSSPGLLSCLKRQSWSGIHPAGPPCGDSLLSLDSSVPVVPANRTVISASRGMVEGRDLECRAAEMRRISPTTLQRPFSVIPFSPRAPLKRST